jgi:hypothetical protein
MRYKPATLGEAERNHKIRRKIRYLGFSLWSIDLHIL